MAKKILVTGAAGFIGSNLCKRLIKAGYRVIGIDNLAYGIRANLPDGIEFHHVDVRDETIHGLFKKVDTVFHLAAKNCLTDCLKDPRETSDINVYGTVNVLEAAKEAGVRKFVYADSSAVYEGVYEFPSRIEEVKPLGAYAVSKHSGALFAWVYHEFNGLNVTALRYFCVYGPAQDYRRTIPPVISAFILKLLQGEQPIIYGDGEKRRDFIHIDDVNDFHLMTIEDRRTDGQTFNLGTGVNYSVNEILQLVSEVLRIKPDPIYLAELPGEAEITLAEMSRATDLGWRPKIDISAGIKDSIDYLKRELRLGAE